MADSIPLAVGKQFPDPRRARLRWACVVLGFCFTALLCLPTWLGFSARHFWLGELSTHFTWQYCWGLPVLLLVCWLCGRRWWAAMVGLTLAVNLWAVVPLFFSPAHSPTPDSVTTGPVAGGPIAGGPIATDRPLRVMTQNVYKPNQRHDQLVQLIQREQPDVFLLVEVNQQWINAIRPIAELYPHQHVQLRGTRSGLALYSRRPLANVRFEKLGPIARYEVFAELEYEGQTVTIVGLHPSLPRRPLNVTWRNEELLAVARAVSNIAGPVVVMGDFNTTPWSPIFGDLLRESGLNNSMRGFGVQPTWSLGGRWPLLLPIDHVLYSDDLVVLDRHVCPDIGSDHRAVVVDFRLRSGK